MAVAGLVFTGCNNTGPLITTKAPAQRPNVLWLIAEDICPDLGCYGNKLVKTPNIDKLAEQGALYTGAFTTAPVCSPSRSALMTGMYQTAIRSHQHRTKNKKPLPPPVKLLTEYFRNAGYFTCSCKGLQWQKNGKKDFNFIIHKAFDGTDWRQRKPHQPFFAQVHFSETHRVFVRDPQNPINPDNITLPPYYPDHPLTRRDWADYLECIQVLDKKVALVLKRLADDGLADNTIVFFFGDNGRPHLRDKATLYDGGIHVPLIIRWPGRIRPGATVDDLVSAIDLAPTSLKLASIEQPEHMHGQVFLGNGAKKREFIFAQKDRVDEGPDRVRCIRTKRLKYIRNFQPNQPLVRGYYKRFFYPAFALMQVLAKHGNLTPPQAAPMLPSRPPEELYDLKNDPQELKNLADAPRYKKALQTTRTELRKWMIRIGDEHAIPELGPDSPPEVAKRRREKYDRIWQKRSIPRNIEPEQYLKYWENQLLNPPANSPSVLPKK